MFDFSQLDEFYIGNKEVQELYVNGNKVWQKQFGQNGLKFTSKQDGSTIKLQAVGSPNSISIEYSLNRGMTYSPYTIGTTITLPFSGSQILFRAGIGGNSTICDSQSNYYKFVMTGKFSMISEDMPYLLSANGVVSTVVPNFAFYSLFSDCESIEGNLEIDFAALAGSTTPSSGAFRNIFYGTGVQQVISSGQNVSIGSIGQAFMNCTSLTKVQLNTITGLTYGGMSNCFNGDTSLQEVELTNLNRVNGSDEQFRMAFYGCTSLKSVKIPLYSETQYVTGSNVWDAAFSGCVALETIDFSQASSIPKISTNTFSNTNNTFKVIVPDALYNDWIAATNWSSISSHVISKTDYEAL